jgi:LuxR family maltose regulon positive regulatory protein
MDLAEPEGIIQTFVDEAEPMARLLTDAARQNLHPEYVSRLLKAFPVPQVDMLADEHSTGDLARPGPGGLIEPLSEREKDVLRLIAEGCLNKEIAQKLYISLRTVKYHTTSIYTKLVVNGRAQAAIKARELGLLK